MANPAVRVLTAAALLMVLAAAAHAAEVAAATDSLAAPAPALARAASAEVPDSTVTDTVSRPAPDFLLPDTDGVPRRFLGYRGRVLVLVYWSPECPECVQEMPRLAKLYERERKHGLAMVGVTYPRLRAEAVAFAKDHKLGFPSLLDGTGRVVRLYDVRRTPTVWVVVNGQVVLRHEGFDPNAADPVGPAVEAALH